MIRTHVKSSDLRSIGYDSNLQLLEIEFQSGGIYQYLSVPQSLYEALMKAPSHGKYFHRHIKDVFRNLRVS